MKPLERVFAGAPTAVPAVLDALRAALGEGPAVWPVVHGAAPVEDRVADRELSAPDEIALVIETSGSTAQPKRVGLSAAALIASTDATHDALGDPGQWLLALPTHYIAGAQVLVRSIVAGTEPVVVSGDRFDAGAFAAASARLMPEVPHYTSLVPLQLARVIEAAERDPFVAAALGSFDAVLVGGQALAPSIAARAQALGARIVRTYGSSETAGGCVYDSRPLDGVDVREVDGAIELAGPMLAEGYYAVDEATGALRVDEARTSQTFSTDRRRTRWYRTGDLGSLDDAGLLSITGRADDVIISGGVKVSLAEIERVVHAVEGMSEAVVVAVPDAEWGQRAAVVVDTTGAASAILAALAAATDAAGLPTAGRPVRIVTERMPRLPSGKPDRRAAARLATDASRLTSATDARD